MLILYPYFRKLVFHLHIPLIMHSTLTENSNLIIASIFLKEFKQKLFNEYNLVEKICQDLLVF